MHAAARAREATPSKETRAACSRSSPRAASGRRARAARARRRRSGGSRRRPAAPRPRSRSPRSRPRGRAARGGGATLAAVVLGAPLRIGEDLEGARRPRGSAPRATGSPGFRSGCSCRACFWYARRTSASVALRRTPSTCVEVHDGHGLLLVHHLGVDHVAVLLRRRAGRAPRPPAAGSPARASSCTAPRPGGATPASAPRPRPRSCPCRPPRRPSAPPRRPSRPRPRRPRGACPCSPASVFSVW